MADKRVEFFKEYIKIQLDNLHESIGDLRYKIYVQTIDETYDYEQLKELAELELQIDYANYIRNNIIEPLKNQGTTIKEVVSNENKDSIILETDDLDEEEIDEEDALRYYAMLQIELQKAVAESEIYTGEEIAVEIEETDEDEDYSIPDKEDMGDGIYLEDDEDELENDVTILDDEDETEEESTTLKLEHTSDIMDKINGISLYSSKDDEITVDLSDEDGEFEDEDEEDDILISDEDSEEFDTELDIDETDEDTDEEDDIFISDEDSDEFDEDDEENTEEDIFISDEDSDEFDEDDEEDKDTEEDDILISDEDSDEFDEDEEEDDIFISDEDADEFEDEFEDESEDESEEDGDDIFISDEDSDEFDEYEGDTEDDDDGIIFKDDEEDEFDEFNTDFDEVVAKKEVAKPSIKRIEKKAAPKEIFKDDGVNKLYNKFDIMASKIENLFKKKIDSVNKGTPRNQVGASRINKEAAERELRQRLNRR